MDEPFEIAVNYKNTSISFIGKLIRYGYTHKIQVSIYGEDILFEPDEEGNYRAVLDYAKRREEKNVDIELLKSIAEAIETIVK